jgi:hypothetical protein
MLWSLIACIVSFILFCLWQWKTPIEAVVEMASGIVTKDCQSLADAAGIDLDTYTIARIMQSEEGMSSDRAKIAVGYAALNHANAKGKSITSIATAGNPKRSDYEQANGRYGRQGIHPYCTTIAAPKPHTIDLAEQVVAGSVEDETQGAQFWDNPLAQLKGWLKDPYNPLTKKGTRHPDEITRRREASGLREVTLSGISTRFWV